MLDPFRDAPWLITESMALQLERIVARETTAADLQLMQTMQAARQERLAARAGERYPKARYATVRDGVAIVPIVGPTMRYADLYSDISGATATEALLEDVQAVLNDPQIRAVMLTLDSPGGQVKGTNALASMIFEARARKPIVAFVGEEACSAAYWVASACAEIVVDATAELGSIGCVIQMADPSAPASGRRLIKFVSKQSPNKQPNPASERGAAQIQQLADDLAAEFVAAVARHRGVSEETVLSDYGAGAVFVGRQAVAAGLADRIGSFEQVLAELTSPTRSARPTMPGRTTQGDRTPMDWKGFWSGMFNAAKEEGVSPDAVAAASEQPTASTETRVVAADDPELVALRAELAARKTAEQTAIASRAETFAAEAVAQKLALPAEQESLAAAYRAIASAESTPTARAEALSAILAARPAHALDAELVPARADDAALLNVTETPDPSAPQALSADRKTELLSATPLGQAALKQG